MMAVENLAKEQEETVTLAVVLAYGNTLRTWLEWGVAQEDCLKDCYQETLNALNDCLPTRALLQERQIARRLSEENSMELHGRVEDE